MDNPNLSNIKNLMIVNPDLLSDKLSSVSNSTFFNIKIFSVLQLLFFLYGGFMSPKLPKHVLRLFEYTLFKILFVFFILYTSSHDFSFSIILATIFIYGITKLHKNELHKEELNKLNKNN